MEIDLIAVKKEEKDILYNLYQFYNYDFSPYTHQDPNRYGRYDVKIDHYWEGDLRWNPYFIVVSGTIVGFLVVLFENYDIDPDPTHVIYDFFILKKHRRNGIGKVAAAKAFKLFHAKWAIAQMENNTPAISFWRNVIREFTDGVFTEIYWVDRRKYVQEFSTKESNL